MKKDVLTNTNKMKAQEIILYKSKPEAIIYRVREKSVKFIFTKSSFHIFLWWKLSLKVEFCSKKNGNYPLEIHFSSTEECFTVFMFLTFLVNKC